MKARIKVDMKMAVKEGYNAYGNIDIEFVPAHLTREEREELATCAIQDDCLLLNQSDPRLYNRIYGNPIKYGDTALTEVSHADITIMRQILQERIELNKKLAVLKKEREAKAAKEKEEKEKKWQEVESKIRKMSNEELYVAWNTNVYDGYDYREALSSRENLKDRKKDYYEWLNNRIEAERKEKEAKKQAEEMERARIAEQKAAQISSWVADKGTENQKKRKELDLLPDEEVINAIRDEAFAPLADYPRYEKLRASDVCDCEYRADGYCDVDFDVYACKATAEEFEEMQKVQKLIPDAKITIREHSGTSEDCENTVTRKSVHVEIQVGAFTFSREYVI